MKKSTVWFAVSCVLLFTGLGMVILSKEYLGNSLWGTATASAFIIVGFVTGEIMSYCQRQEDKAKAEAEYQEEFEKYVESFKKEKKDAE